MTACIALLRGVNVGRAKRIAMADLRKLVEDLGHSSVRTLLNSGNVIFEAARPSAIRIGMTIEAAIQKRHGFRAPAIVLTAQDLDRVVAEYPWARVADPARTLVAFVSAPATLSKARTLLTRSWTPDALAVGGKAAYLWCATGLIESRLLQAFVRAMGEAATTRNWATVLKLQAAAGASGDAVRCHGTLKR